MARSILIVAFYFTTLISQSLQSIPTFDLDPTCLLQTALTHNTKSSDFSAKIFKQNYYETLISAHSNGIVVKHLLPNYFRRRDEFPLWKINCMQILVFDQSGEINDYSGEIINWGTRNDVTIYFVLSPTSFKILGRSQFYSYLDTFRIPVYKIYLDIRHQVTTVYGVLSSPIRGYYKWKKFTRGVQTSFPSPRQLRLYRIVLSNNQQKCKLPLDRGWIRKMNRVDCENHREFVRFRSPCFTSFGPLLIVSRKLNFTFDRTK